MLYTYDKVGNLKTVKDWNNNVTTYSYDENNQLIPTEKLDDSIEIREYVIKGQFTKLVNTGSNRQMATYGLDTTNHDKDGNLLNIPLNGELLAGTYDARNRLTAIGDMKHFYNAENKRTAIEENGEITRFVVSPYTALDQVLMETDSNGSPTAYYVYGKGLISKGNASGNNSYYHYDRRGSTVALTNNSGEVTDTYTYDIYGEHLTKEGETSNRFLYNGKYGVQTDNNGLYYMRARYYNSEIKRFINRDVIQGSILESQTFNRYSYVNGNPISYIDPFGLSREEDMDSILKYSFEMTYMVMGFPTKEDIETIIHTLGFPYHFSKNNFLMIKGELPPKEWFKLNLEETINACLLACTMGEGTAIKAGFNKFVSNRHVKTFVNALQKEHGLSTVLGGGVLLKAKKKPYSNPKYRPKYAPSQVEEVWKNAQDKDGRVFDPYTGEELFWDKTKSRNKQWDMGHLQNKKYSDLHKDYMDDKITLEQFLEEYRNPKNYQPESWLGNRSHKNE